MTDLSLRSFALKSTLLYLYFPILLWLVSWLKPSLGWTISLLSIVALIVVWKTLPLTNNSIYKTEYENEMGKKNPLLTWTYIFLPLGISCMVSGVGGLSYQNYDWEKHNAILNDLINFPWPVYYPKPENDLFLSYYIAYYLPAAIVGKIGGWSAANLALLIWSLMGYAIIALWIAILTKYKFRWIGWAFVLYSGLDILGWLIMKTLNIFFDFSRQTWPPQDILMEWWTTILLMYPSSGNVITWAPQHAIPAWLAGAIVIYAFLNTPSKPITTLAPYLTFCIILTLFWSPFVTISSVVALIFYCIFHRHEYLQAQTKEKLSFCLVGLAASSIGVVFFLYLTSHNSLLQLPTYNGSMMKLEFFTASIHTRNQIMLAWMSYFLFCVFEFGLLVVAAYMTARNSKLFSEQRRLFYSLLAISTLILVFLPLLHYGSANDLPLKSSIMPLFCLFILSIIILDKSKQTDPSIADKSIQLKGAAKSRNWTIAILSIGGLNSLWYWGLFLYMVQLDWKDKHRTLQLPKTAPSRSIPILYKDQPQFFVQYLSLKNSMFGNYFLKPLSPTERKQLLDSSKEQSNTTPEPKRQVPSASNLFVK